MKEHITRLVESTAALSDPFAADIYYHHSCWLTYVNYKDSSLENMRLYNLLLQQHHTPMPFCSFHSSL